MGEDKAVAATPHSCASHDYDYMKPVVLATWKHGFQGACPDKSAILAESQVGGIILSQQLYKRIIQVLTYGFTMGQQPRVADFKGRKVF